MARHLQITMTTALVVLAGSFSAGARSSMPADDRWNAQHIDALPPEVRNAIASHTLMCGGPLAAEHSFARYLQNGTVKLIGLHFENVRCGNRASILQGFWLPPPGLHFERWRSLSPFYECLCPGA
jgi:hypothetical protein